MGLVLKQTSDFRGALEAFRKSLNVARIRNSRSPSGYSIRKEYDSLMEIAEALHESGETDVGLTVLRESFEVRRKWTELNINKDALRTYGGHAYLFYAGGKLLMRMKRFDEALDAFREAENAHLKVLKGEPKQLGNRRNLATLYLTLGDFHAGLGVCNFERAKSFDAISESYRYCPTDAINSTKNRTARNYYEKAARLLNELETNNTATAEDKENLRLAAEKIRLAEKN